MNTEIINVLLVEDDDDDIFITKHLLDEAEQHNFRVKTAETLGEAFLIIDKDPPQVILLDLSLPDSQGRKTFDDMLSHTSTIPVILLTGFADKDISFQAVQEGAQDYLFKGQIDRERLSRSIHYAIERKSSELELKEYRDDLEKRVAERTKELQEANKQLRKHDRARSDFVFNVSHELKTPLASMSYAIDNMLKGIVGELPKEAIKYIEMLKEDAQRMAQTVGDILDLSRIESNTFKLDRVRIPLSRLVKRTVKSLQLQADENKLDLNFAPDPALGFAECDPRKTERVILNIIRNAIKFTPAHGNITVKLTVKNNDDNMFHISVTDSGIGIPYEYLNKVTERYFRIGEHVDGTGLGLAISKEILELHGGGLELASPPPGLKTGTQVNIFIPKSLPLSVMAVDDDLMSRKLINAQLSAKGYITTCCKNGAEAIDRLEKETPDIILTDLAMPILDGTAMIAEIKSHPQWRFIPIIAITGGELSSAKREILEGFDIPALAKPYQFNDLLDLIESTVFGMQYLNQE